MNTFDLILDLSKRRHGAQWLAMRQGDRMGTTIRAAIYDHGTLISGNYTARVSIRLPGSGGEYYRETASLSSGIATVTIDETYAASVPGVTEGYFEILQGSTVIASTESFGVTILRSATDGAVVAEPYDSAIQEALDELDEATGRISRMVIDATNEYMDEYITEHPEAITTVQDDAVTYLKLNSNVALTSSELAAILV